MPENNKKSFLDWLVQGAQDARDAKIGAVGAGTVRQLYNEGKPEEAQEMAKNLTIAQGSALSLYGGKPLLSTVWKILNHPITQTIGTIDGFRNLFTGNGVKKTYNHFKNGEYGRASLSLAGDILDASPLISIGKSLPHFYRIFKNPMVDKLETFDDVFDSGVAYWQRQIDPQITKSEYAVRESNKLDKDLLGDYNPTTRSIRIKYGIPRSSQRNALIHEMRHQEDFNLNNKHLNGIYSSFLLEDSGNSLLGKTFGRISLPQTDNKILNHIYKSVPSLKEKIAVNADFRATLEEFSQRYFGRYLSRNELNNYIQELPWPVLALGRLNSGYSSLRSTIPILFTPNKVKSTLINIK